LLRTARFRGGKGAGLAQGVGARFAPTAYRG